ncbi:threonine-phosphate decarboxylase CobD [Mesorhizobium sp. SB112]|uniref:threonine-phosphate decarboxylase CobD n=1 Tax=Mesorhizobium sp. SB112 TaxID=3151853 RepID=UPI0032640511
MALLNENPALPVDHGGSFERARKLFPNAPEPWIDLSTGINPHSYPLFDLPATAFTRLPEPSRAKELTAIAAKAYGAASSRQIVAAPGTQILLPRVASLVGPGRAMVLGPTYAEHERAARIAGHDVSITGDFEALFGADLAILVNPNNPDGRIVPRQDVLRLARHLQAKGGLLVVDEAFMDVGPREESVAGDVALGGLVVLRSFGKFFGLAGVRLGFGISSEEIAAKLDAELGPWAVSGQALEFGIKALSDEVWQSEIRVRLALEAGRFASLFSRFGVEVSGGTSLFSFFRIEKAQNLFEFLGKNGVILRNFADRPNDFRAGLPASEAEWQRLESILQRWAEEENAS